MAPSPDDPSLDARALAGTPPAPSRPLARAAVVLGALGLVPFAAMAGLLVYAGRDFIAYPTLVLALSGYAAAILSFLGGIRWGAAIMRRGESETPGTLVLSVVPSLAAWVLLLVPAPWGFLAFAAAFLLQGALDVIAARRGALPAWFGRLRVWLTAGATLSMLLAFAATLR